MDPDDTILERAVKYSKLPMDFRPGTGSGYSGAYGTHFYVDPVHELEVVLGVNRSNIGGAASYVSYALEEAVKEMFYPQDI